MKKGEIDIITLGCSKNLVDAERLMRQLELAGYRCVHDSANPKGEIAIINTCGFIGDAKEESIDIILQFAERKTKGKLRKLYVMGCLSQRYRNELPAEIPEVDKWFGKFDYMGIVNEVKGESLEEHPTTQVSLGTPLVKGEDYERKLTTPKHYAYLKIAEGCNRYCSYCAIPLITGKFTAFTGNTGVGKSSMLNKLCPELSLATGEVSEKLGRGRHTTRHVELYTLDEDTFVADTPGFSSFDTDQMEVILKENLQYAFPDFGDFVGCCQFHDCSHRAEPGCAVRAAVESGAVEKTRYDSYLRLYEKSSQIKLWELK